MKKIKILITGGAGYIGSKFANTVIKENCAVVVVDNFSSGIKKNLDKRVKIYNTDICSSKILSIFKKEKPQIIYHLAASKSVNDSLEKPMEFAKTNILGSINVINSAYKAGIKKIIFTSTAGVYGENFVNEKQQEDQETFPSSPYAWTKLTIENYLSYMNMHSNMQGIVLRFANVYGVGGESPYESVVNIFIKKLLKNEPIIIHGDGKQTRDFIYIDDLIDIFIKLIQTDGEKLKKKLVFNVSTGKEIPVLSLLQLISKLMNRNPICTFEKTIFSGQKRSVLDTSKAENILGWKAKVSLEQGVKELITAEQNKNI